jgi:hypothetical protein
MSFGNLVSPTLRDQALKIGKMANNTYDKLINWLKDNPLIAIVIFGFVLFTSVGKIFEAEKLIKERLFGKETTEQVESNPEETPPTDAYKPSLESQVVQPPSNTSEGKISKEKSSSPSYPDRSNQPESRQYEASQVNYANFLNTALKNSPSGIDICVTITDEAGKALGSESSAIAEVYSQSGKTGKTGLFRSTFLKRAEFHELREGNNEVIEKLGLANYTDFVAIGTISYAFRDGKLVEETVVCSITLAMDIISANTQSIEKSFTLSNINGNGATEDQARENAFQKLLDNYYTNYSTL